MKDVEQILVEAYGIGLKKSLTETDYGVMMKGDQEISSSMPDAKSSKMIFVKKMQEKYENIDEHFVFWKEEELRLKEQYPAIHKGE